MVRRLHVSKLFVGQVPLDPAQARHARDVLRLREGEEVELFNDAGQSASGTLLFLGSNDLAAQVKQLDAPKPPTGPRLTIVSAVPKGERADWMIEKLSELGVDVFIPISTERSIVKPEGKNKMARWARIATESAKQSRRVGVMKVKELQPLAEIVQEIHNTVYLSTEPTAVPIFDVLTLANIPQDLTLLIGPEGGWSSAEIELFGTFGIQSVKLTSTVLRIETAAVAGAAVATVLLQRAIDQEDFAPSRGAAKNLI